MTNMDTDEMNTKAKQMTYEEAMKRLEAIALELEKGELGLAGQLAVYEEGMALAKRCQKELEQVEERLRMLTENGDEVQLDGR